MPTRRKKRRLDVVQVSETGPDGLQSIVDNWAAQSNNVGVPSWFASLGKPDGRRDASLNSYGFDLEVDAWWKSAAVVAELKSASKYEPLALPQTLIAAWKLEQLHGRRFLPVLITRYHGWLRGAIQALHDRGLASEAIKFFEVTTLKEPAGTHQKYYLFEEPLAPWEACELPSAMASIFEPAQCYWYKANENSTWYATPIAIAVRQPFITCNHAMISLIGSGTQTEQDSQYVFWQGNGILPSTGSISKNDKRFDGEYELLTLQDRNVPVFSED